VPEHVKHACDAEDCQVCSGGLFLCTVCNGGEGELTTECPGVPMTLEQFEASYAGKLDYVAGAFVDTTSESRVALVVLAGFFRAVHEAKSTEALVAVWIECRRDIQKNLESRLQVESWATLCRKAEQLGQQHPKIWMKRAVIDEVARRTEASRRAETERELMEQCQGARLGPRV